LGLVLFLSIFISGNGLGASGGIGRINAALADLVDPSFVDQNPCFSHFAGGPAKPLANRMIWMLAGVAVGGFFSGWLGGRLKFETIRGPRVGVHTRWIMAITGGALMGWGAALARGCTSGQALSGGAVLGAGSWAFMMMVFAGCYLIAYPLRKLWL
jgi:hypothetical protein